jgi:hypothetical protein
LIIHAFAIQAKKKTIMLLESLQHIETMPHQQLQDNSTRVGAIVRFAN